MHPLYQAPVLLGPQSTRPLVYQVPCLPCILSTKQVYQTTVLPDHCIPCPRFTRSLDYQAPCLPCHCSGRPLFYHDFSLPDPCILGPRCTSTFLYQAHGLPGPCSSRHPVYLIPERICEKHRFCSYSPNSVLNNSLD